MELELIPMRLLCWSRGLEQLALNLFVPLPSSSFVLELKSAVWNCFGGNGGAGNPLEFSRCDVGSGPCDIAPDLWVTGSNSEDDDDLNL